MAIYSAVEPLDYKDCVIYALPDVSFETAFSFRNKPLLAFHGTDRELRQLSVRSQGLHFAAPISQATDAVTRHKAAIRCPHTPFYEGANIFVAVLKLSNPLVMHDPWKWNCPVRLLSSLPTRFEPLKKQRRKLHIVDPPNCHDLESLKTNAEDFGFNTEIFERKTFEAWKRVLLPKNWEPGGCSHTKNKGFIIADFFHVLQKHGYDSVVYQNRCEGRTGWSALVFNDNTFLYYYSQSFAS